MDTNIKKKKDNSLYHKTLYRDNISYDIKIINSDVHIIEKYDNSPEKDQTIIRAFLTKEEALECCRECIFQKIKEGFRDWIISDKKDESSIVSGAWGSKKIARQLTFHNRKRPKQQALKKIKEEVIPDGYIEISKDMADEIEKIAGLLAEFMKQSKRTKAIKDIRNLMKSKKIYQSIQYKVNFALDQFEEKGILLAKWSSKKNNKVSRLTEPTSLGVMTKASNLKVIIISIFEMCKILKGLLIHHDPRTPEQVKKMGRKGLGRRILIRPKLLPTIRFFEEGKELYQSVVSMLQKFQKEYPEIAYRLRNS